MLYSIIPRWTTKTWCNCQGRSKLPPRQETGDKHRNYFERLLAMIACPIQWLHPSSLVTETPHTWLSRHRYILCEHKFKLSIFVKHIFRKAQQNLQHKTSVQHSKSNLANVYIIMKSYSNLQIQNWQTRTVQRSTIFYVPLLLIAWPRRRFPELHSSYVVLPINLMVAKDVCTVLYKHPSIQLCIHLSMHLLHPWNCHF